MKPRTANNHSKLIVSRIFSHGIWIQNATCKRNHCTQWDVLRLLNMLVIIGVQQRIPMLVGYTHINALHEDASIPPPSHPPSPPPWQISVEDRNLQRGNQLRCCSSTSMRSHGNPQVDQHDSMWPYEMNLTKSIPMHVYIERVILES